VFHAKTLPSNPYDGHALGSVIDAAEKLTGCAIERAYVDKGYRGHDTANPRRVFISGQKRGVFDVIKRELRRRSAIEPVIGHMKTDGHLGHLPPPTEQLLLPVSVRDRGYSLAIDVALGDNLRLPLRRQVRRCPVPVNTSNRSAGSALDLCKSSLPDA
jgi:hypothetical protein